MCLLEFRWVWGLCTLLFLLSSIRLFLSMHWCDNFSNQHFPQTVYLGTTASISCATLEVLEKHIYILYFHCKIQAKLKWAWQHSMVAVILSLSLKPYFNGLKMKLNICHAPFWRGLKLCSMQSQIFMTQAAITPNTTVTLIHTTYYIATCYNYIINL